MAELLEAGSGSDAGSEKKPIPPLSPKGQTLYKKDVLAARAKASAAEAEVLRLRKLLEEREAGQREWAARLASGDVEMLTSGVMAKVLGQRRERDEGPVEELLRAWLDQKGIEAYGRLLEERRGIERSRAREKELEATGGGELPSSEVERMLDGVISEILGRIA